MRVIALTNDLNQFYAIYVARRNCGSIIFLQRVANSRRLESTAFEQRPNPWGLLKFELFFRAGSAQSTSPFEKGDRGGF
jgi:hypothetical protein